MRCWVAAMLMLGLPAAALAQDGDVLRGKVIGGRQWYVDGRGYCFTIAPNKDVVYDNRLKCRLTPPPENTVRYYKDIQGNCYTITPEGKPLYEFQKRC